MSDDKQSPKEQKEKLEDEIEELQHEFEEDDRASREQDFGPRGFGRRAYDSEGKSAIWLISFTDVMALMLTFFVLLFAMSHPKEEEWTGIAEEVQKQFSKFKGMQLNIGPRDSVNIQKINLGDAHSLSYIKTLSEQHMGESEHLKTVSIIPQPPEGDRYKFLIISFPENLLFEAGNTIINEKGSQALYDLAVFLDKIPNAVEIVGHADPRPIQKNDLYESNWELSLSRAASVAAALQNYGYKKDIIVRGQSSGRFEDLPTSLGVGERLSLSRRVDLVILPDTGKQSNIIGFQ